MSGSDLTIDMMELADLAQPRKIAWEIHKQLRSQFGAVPRRVPLEKIAAAVGVVAIEEFDTDAFEGTLVIANGKGAIGLRRGLLPGRRNFTLGHELGHFLNPWHRRVGLNFECDKRAVKAVRSSGFDLRPAIERVEVEANEFSAALLVPSPEYRAARKELGIDNDVTHIRTLADAFAVSQEFMARVYVDQSDRKICVIHSLDDVVQRLNLAREFPYLGLQRGAPIPRLSLTHQFRRSNGPGTASDLCEIATSTWLDNGRGVIALYEQVLVQKDGWATTVLEVDEDQEDDDADDSNWNRRSFRR